MVVIFVLVQNSKEMSRNFNTVAEINCKILSVIARKTVDASLQYTFDELS